jgi:hypothetical protein
MYKLHVLWWIPNDGAWEHGWDEVSFRDERAAFEFCRKFITGIEIAEHRLSGALFVADGYLLCTACGARIRNADKLNLPLCEDCDE